MKVVHEKIKYLLLKIQGIFASTIQFNEYISNLQVSVEKNTFNNTVIFINVLKLFKYALNQNELLIII